MQTLASIILVGDSFGMCVVFLVIAGVIALVIWSITHQKKVREAWNQFGRTHNLQIQGSPARPTVQGWYGSTWIGLNTVTRGSGKNRSTFTQYHATVNAPMPNGIVLYKEGFFSKVGKTFGGQDVQTGDRQLDDAFIIKGTDLLGIHELLNLPPVKQALLYVIARHPGIRIEGKRILVEHSGMTGDLNKLESMFSDLSYLAQTFDAAYQEIANRKGGGAPAAKAPERQTKYNSKSNRSAPVASKAAAAEILGTEFFNRKEHSPEPANRGEALTQMADVLHQYEEKLQTGKVRPEAKDSADILHDYSPSDSMDNAASSAFSDQDTSDVFATSNTSGRNVLDAYDPSNVWHSRKASDAAGAFDEPDASDAFSDPKPMEDKPEAKPDAKPAKAPLEVGVNIEALLAKLSDSSMMSGDRKKLIEENRGKTWELELVVDRVDTTWGFDIAEALRDGKTIEGQLKGADTKISMRFPRNRNDEVGKLKSGEVLKAWGTLTDWDDLFKKATLEAN